mmetsp:Transcript_84191/g.238530  ORF Transcript_84191/g.238530 Transcript_84191/m.238530 type:complete len:264 (+) Transcript_84191:2149-2940(+)
MNFSVNCVQRRTCTSDLHETPLGCRPRLPPPLCSHSRQSARTVKGSDKLPLSAFRRRSVTCRRSRMSEWSSSDFVLKGVRSTSQLGASERAAAIMAASPGHPNAQPRTTSRPRGTSTGSFRQAVPKMLGVSPSASAPSSCSSMSAARTRSSLGGVGSRPSMCFASKRRSFKSFSGCVFSSPWLPLSSTSATRQPRRGPSQKLTVPVPMPGIPTGRPARTIAGSAKSWVRCAASSAIRSSGERSTPLSSKSGKSSRISLGSSCT